MSCKCGFPNNDKQLKYCTACGGTLSQSNPASFAEQMFMAPEFVFMIYTVGQRKQLMRGLRFMALLLMLLVLLSLNIVMFAVLMPLYVYWFYFRHNFAKKWRRLSYSPITLNICLVLIAAVCVTLRPVIQAAISLVTRF